MNPFPPALSFSQNPDFKELIATVSSSVEPVTVICGAGITRDAGLPGWGELVQRMLTDIPSEFRSWMTNDPMTDARKISVAEAFLPKHMHNGEILRRALYADVRGEARPGLLATAIARFVTAESEAVIPNVRLATTNFDDLLEIALRGHNTDARSLTLRERDQWDASANSVLHLHGVVPSDGGLIRGPIILTESDFLVSSELVRSTIVKILTTSHVVFVGMSMTDPNIVGPLLLDEARRSKYRQFLIVTPETSPNDSTTPEGESREFFRYVRSRQKAIARHLGITPVYLNSIAQNAQVFIELALCRSRQKEYLDDHSSIRYGPRFTRYSRQSLQHFGLRDGDHRIWQQERQKAIGDLLFSRLHVVRACLQQIARDIDYAEATGHLVQDFLADENLALFLWARSVGNERGHPQFSVELVGNSAYQHREAWSGEILAPVAEQTIFAAATCVYNGNATIGNLSYAPGQRTLWKSIFATPINIELSGAEITCGAVTLNSPLSTVAEISAEAHGSILGYFRAQDIDAVSTALRGVGAAMFPIPD